jgi:translation elongation factor EF-1alpha
MDMTNPPWDKTRYDTIVDDVTSLLLSLRFTDNDITFVPVSGLSGINLTNKRKDISTCNNMKQSSGLLGDEALRLWYSGKSLLEALDGLRTPRSHLLQNNEIDQKESTNSNISLDVTNNMICKEENSSNDDLSTSLRAVVCSVVSQNSRTVDIGVSVLRGKLQRLSRLILPEITAAGTMVVVQKIVLDSGLLNSSTVEIANAGSRVVITIAELTGRSPDEWPLRVGLVIYKSPTQLVMCKKFLATILIMSTIEMPIIPGASFEMYLHGQEV